MYHLYLYDFYFFDFEYTLHGVVSLPLRLTLVSPGLCAMDSITYYLFDDMTAIFVRYANNTIETCNSCDCDQWISTHWREQPNIYIRINEQKGLTNRIYATGVDRK